MNKPLKITRIGNSAGVVLPKAVLAHLEADIGDQLTVVRTSRGIELSKREFTTEDQMEAAREVMARRHQAMMALAERIMEEDRAILAELAKS